MTRTPTDHPPLAPTGPTPGAGGEPTVPISAGPRPRRSGAHTSNPVRIGQIGADHIQVSIRPARDDAELLVLVDRLERLIDAGYDSIDVVYEGITRPLRIDDREDHEMTELVDKTGAPVTISLEEGSPIGAYTVHDADGMLAGRADFMDNPEVDGERIFFHTEVGRGFSGRGLGGLLVREALADSVRQDLTVVPVCPLFAAYLDEHGDAFLADGGRSRPPAPADIALVRSELAREA